MKFIFAMLTLIFTVACAPAFADSLARTKAMEFGLNQGSPNMLQKYQLGTEVVAKRLLTLTGTYDFATQGGAVGTKNLRGVSGQPVVIPHNAIVTDCIIDVKTAPTSGGSATIAFSTGQGAGDLKAATAIASYTGLVACVPVGSAATSIKMTADRTMTATIATAALTAGVITVHVQYYLSSAQ